MTPVDVGLQPTVRFGSGVKVGHGLVIVGPLAITPESTPVVAGQVGDAVTFLFTEPSFLSFTLGATFQGKSGVVRLVARDSIDVNQITDLAVGDILVINGRTTAGEYATALASLTGSFQQVALPSVADSNRNVVFKYFEAPIDLPLATYAFGLRNSDLTSAGVDIVDDASVALLDRAAPVVTYYTSPDGNLFTLHRLVGDPARPAEDEPVVEAAAAPLTAIVEWAGSPGVPEAMIGITLSVPLAAPETGNRTAGPVESHLNLSGAIGRAPVTLHYRYLGETTSGEGGGGK